MKQAIGYIRVSTDKQANEGVSLEAQEAAIREWCEANKCSLLGLFRDEGLSGSLPVEDRPGLWDALALMKKAKGCALVVTKRDRLSRDYVEAGLIDRECAKVKSQVIALDGADNSNTPEAMIQRGMFDLFASYERDLIRKRTRTALQHKKATGQVYGTTPYGFEAIEGRLVEVQQEAAVVAEIQAARTGGTTLQAICNDLNGRGIPTKTGKQWRPTTIHNLLKRSVLVAAH